MVTPGAVLYLEEPFGEIAAGWWRVEEYNWLVKLRRLGRNEDGTLCTLKQTVTAPAAEMGRFVATEQHIPLTEGFVDASEVGAQEAINTPERQITPEQQVLNCFLQQTTADRIRQLYAYIDANGRQYTPLMNCVPMVALAAHLYGAGDYVNAFNLSYQICQAIAVLRSRLPGMPSIEACTTHMIR